jgi:hypothetical protein
MPTMRTPIRRSPSPVITPKALELFEQMRRCRSDERWWKLQNDLCDELHTRPWEYPCVEHPDTSNPYPPGTPAHLSWRPNDRAQEMWKALDAASREAKRAAREARKAAPRTQPPAP